MTADDAETTRGWEAAFLLGTSRIGNLSGMMKKAFLSLSLLLLLAGSLTAAESLHRRIWQFQSRNEGRLLTLIEAAPKYGITEVQFSVNLVASIDDLKRPATKELVRRLASAAKKQGLRVAVWSQELNLPDADPKTVCRDPEGAGRRMWEARQQAYREALADLPEVDGVVLTLRPSELAPGQASDHCDFDRKLTGDQKAELTIGQIRQVVVEELGRELIVRAAVSTPQELEAMKSALRRMSGFTIMVPAAAPDWEADYRQHPIFGSAGAHPTLAEFDLAGESDGLPCALTDDLQWRLQYALQEGLIGAAGRVDRAEEPASGVITALNRYAFSRLLVDPATDADLIWQQWAAGSFGVKPHAPAADHLVAALRRTFDVGRKTDRTLGLRFDPGHPDLFGALQHPTEDTLDRIDQEKYEAVWLADESLRDLEIARPDLRPADYEALRHDLLRLRRRAEVRRFLTLILFRNRCYQDTHSDRTRAWLEGNLQALSRLADSAPADPAIGNPAQLHAFIADLRQSLGPSPVNPEEKPRPRLSAIHVDSIYPQSASISWQSDPPGDAVIEYTTRPPFDRTAEPTASSDSLVHSVSLGPSLLGRRRVVLQNLTPDARYYFRVRSRDAEGREVVSGDFRFVTPPAAPLAQMANPPPPLPIPWPMPKGEWKF
jgi:hypothetical protein